MASKIIVNEISAPTTGVNANKVIIPSGVTLAAPGHVVQYIKTAYLTSEQSTTSTSYSDITGASLSITPTSTSSIILIGWCGVLGGSGGFRFTKDGTALATTNDTYQYYDSDTNGQTNWKSGSTRTRFHEQIFDEPATTSSITYKVQFARYTSSGFGINEANVAREGSFLYLMEIAQ